jgi:hypothetical protein
VFVNSTCESLHITLPVLRVKFGIGNAWALITTEPVFLQPPIFTFKKAV